ncbi:hypothetical protein GDO86_019345 [Hymenochirus boettgeri]|uniref:Androgen-dependent TFPI-regulating protein n=1 Tax=Hymenochirus boettgeri TaxID=247094 RepID=A0A8T2IG87_9PIPI|nr:hypothetical protein GDO86_019345 [Hymenochirus boettgeri]
MVLQTVFFGICVLTDLSHLLLSSNKRIVLFLQQLRDLTFSSLAFPIGLFVVTSFWSIYAFDRELVYPKVLDSIIPQWLNHSMHTVVLPLLLLEVFASSHHYPSRKRGLFALIFFCLLYMSWVFWIHYASGIWVYPLLAKLDAVGRGIFFTISLLIAVPFYCLGEYLTWLRWGARKPAKKKRKSK